MSASLAFAQFGSSPPLTHKIKTCSKCSTPKDTSEFRGDATRPDGLHSWCNPCTKKNTSVRLQGRRDRKQCKQCGEPAGTANQWLCDIHQAAAITNKRNLMAYRKENKLCRDCGEPQKKKNESRYCAKHLEQARNRHLLYDHGISAGEFENKIRIQQDKCAISGLVITDGYGEKLRVDHDHRHDKYHKRRGQTSCPLCQRGLLLHEINLALGLAEKFSAAMSPSFRTYLDYWNPIVEQRCEAAGEPL